MNFFERYLSVWVILCMAVGVFISVSFPAVPTVLEKMEYANISIPITILIWFMVYPMMMKVDFDCVKDVRKNPKGLMLTWVSNWLVKPFSMFFFAWFFFDIVFDHFIPDALAKEYLVGAVLLGAAPCTAMVFVWSQLTKGNANYTVVQVASNDLLILVAFVPIVKLLLGVNDVFVPWDTLFLSITLFLVIPLVAGMLTRKRVMKVKGEHYFEQSFLPKFSKLTMLGLLLTLVIIFTYQGDVILKNPLQIGLISVPLIIQTIFIFIATYLAAKFLKLPHNIAAPAGMIGASNFFELAVAVAIALFGAGSSVALVTIVGVLVEVPLMLLLVRFANRTTSWFNSEIKSLN